MYQASLRWAGPSGQRTRKRGGYGATSSSKQCSANGLALVLGAVDFRLRYLEYWFAVIRRVRSLVRFDIGDDSISQAGVGLNGGVDALVYLVVDIRLGARYLGVRFGQLGFGDWSLMRIRPGGRATHVDDEIGDLDLPVTLLLGLSRARIHVWIVRAMHFGPLHFGTK